MSFDYLFSGTGSGLTAWWRPAANAGMKKGDIVVRMGDYDVNDMMGTWKASPCLRKGRSRGGDCGQVGLVLDVMGMSIFGLQGVPPRWP